MLKIPSSSLVLDIVPVTPFRQNCSILWDENTHRGIVIDPGGEIDDVLHFIGEHKLFIEKILITHGHLDHAGGANALDERLGQIQAERPELLGPQEGDDFLLGSIERQAAFFRWEEPKNVSVDRFVRPGEEIKCLGTDFKVVHVPGHTPGHVAYVSQKLGIAFVGDILFHNTVGRTDFSYGNHEQLISGIKSKLLPLGDDMIVVPGHGRLTTMGEEKNNNPRLNAI